MTAPEGVLALDQGSHSSRACLFDGDGQLVATARQTIATRQPAPDRVEHDAVEIADSLRRVTAECLAQAPGYEVRHAGLATQRSSIVCVEAGSLRPLSPVLSWQDRRNAAWLARLAPHAAAIRALTGLPLSPHYGASKLRWCLDHLPEVQAAHRERRLLLAPLASYLASALTGGAPAVDPANASRTLLWDSASGNWHAQLLQWFDIERSCLPETRPTQADYGLMRCGQRQLTLRAVSGDQSVVPFAFGPLDPAAAWVNLGTGAFIQRALGARPAHPEPLLGSVLTATAGDMTYSLEGTVNGAASAVDWHVADTGIAANALWQGLAQLPRDAQLPLFLNGIGGVGSPWWLPNLASRFLGEGDAVQRFAAIIESIVFMVAANLRLMQERGQALAHCVVTGGLSRSDWLCQNLANAAGLPVWRGETEATARGIAALAAPQLAARWSPAITARYNPEPHPAQQARMQQCLRLLDAEQRAAS